MDFVSVAHIVKTRGVRGEVAADVLTDFPKRFASIRQVRILRGDQVFEEVVERHWFQQDRVILKFQGRDTPESAQSLVGGYLQVPESERVPLPRNTYYYSDLTGCEVKEDGHVVGTVTGVFQGGGESENLVIAAADGKEVMMPLARAFVTRVDIRRKVVHVKGFENFKF